MDKEIYHLPSDQSNINEDLNELHENKAHAPRIGIFGCVVLLSSTALGGGILSTPYSFFDAGVICAVIILIFLGLVNSFSLWLMAVSGNYVGAKTYEELCEQAFPKVGKLVLSVLLQVCITTGLTGFIVIIDGSISSVLETFEVPVYWYSSHQFVLVLFVIVIIFPLCMLRNISRLEYAGLAAVAIIAGLSIITVVYGSTALAYRQIKWNEINFYKPDTLSVVEAMTLLGGAYLCNTNLFPVWRELHNPTVYRINTVQRIQTLIALTLYTLVGFFGYIQFPTNVNSNILLSFPKNIFFLVVRIIFAFAISFHYPIYHFGLRVTIEELFFKKYQFSWIRHTIETVTVLTLTTTLALFLKTLGAVQDLSFSLTGYTVGYTLPSLCYMKIIYNNKKHSWEKFTTWEKFKDFVTIEIALAFCLCVFSICMSGLSLYMTIIKNFIT